jgi:hypothetical protein
MEITREDFIKREIELLCWHCFRKYRIIDAARKELPEKGFLDEMKEQFDNIAIRES